MQPDIAKIKMNAEKHIFNEDYVDLAREKFTKKMRGIEQKKL